MGQDHDVDVKAEWDKLSEAEKVKCGTVKSVGTCNA